MQHITATAQEEQKIQELMKAPFPVTLSTVAKALQTTELEAAAKMPEDVVRFVNGNVAEQFDEIWAELAQWEKVTLFIVHDGHVFEIQGKLHTGKRARGYYNILAKDAVIGGHLRYEGVAACAFTNFPFMGRESLAVQFFNQAGEVSFSVYVGRENHQLIESVREAFFAAQSRFCSKLE